MTYSADPQTWVTSNDLAALMPGGVVPVDQAAEAAALITQYAGEFEAEINRHLVVDVENEVCDIFGGVVATRQRPVIEVTSIVYRISGGTPLFDLSSGNIKIPDYSPAAMPVGEQCIVSYEASFPEPTIAGARNAVCERVMRHLIKSIDDALGTDEVSEEGYTARYIPEGWDEAGKSLIASLRRRVGA